MICYRDRSYCGNEKCLNYEKCKESASYAFKEKKKSDDPFIRDEIPVCGYFPEKCPITGKPFKKNGDGEDER